MDRITGYVVGVENPNFSGLATVTIAEKPAARVTRDPGQLTRAYIEAGFGVRQLVNYFGGWQQMVLNSQNTQLVFSIDGGLITDIRSPEEN
jgi:hypothetical protein